MLGLLVLFALAYGLLILIGSAAVVWQMQRPRRKTLGVTLAMGGVADPAELGLVGQEVTFNLADGSASPGWIIEGRDPEGPAAVIVHGHRDSRYGSLYRAEMLAPYCRSMTVFDLPGHGDAAATRCLMGEREADDVRAVVEGLPATITAGRPLVLLGYSMGATIVIKAAAEFPEMFSNSGGVIACAPYRYWDEGLRSQMKRRGLPTWPIVAVVGWCLRAAAWWRFAGKRSKFTAAQLKLPGAGGVGFDRARDAGVMGCPLLVLHGDADTICPLSAGRAIAEAAKDGELVVIEGGTHNQLLGADYAGVHRALASFFKKLGKSG